MLADEGHGAAFGGSASWFRRGKLAALDALTVEVREVPVEVTYGLRRRILRDGDPDAEVAFAGDADQGAYHLAVVDERGCALAVATAHPAPTEHRQGRRSWRVRGMAVEPRHQGHGLGAVLLDAVIERARDAGAEVLWAAGRDAALGFYRRQGWEVEGQGYLLVDHVPHHTVVLDLTPGAGRDDGGHGGTVSRRG